MKWVRKDYKGEEQVWYSGDLIDRIVSFIQHNDHLPPREAKILKIIEESENGEE